MLYLPRPKTLLTLTLSILLCPFLWAVQPADANADSVISADELAAFVSVANSDTEAARRAVNIWKHGESYRSITENTTTYHVPAPANGRTFIAPATLNPIAAESVALHGLPTNAAGYAAFFYDTEAEDVVFKGTVVEKEGEYRLRVPPHPLGAMVGGDLEFVIHPADVSPTPANSYYTGTMSVQGLTPDPGTLSTLRQKIDTLVLDIEQGAGVDFSEYFAGGAKENGPFESELEQTLVLLVRYFQDPQFPGGLVELDEQILDGSSPFLVDMRDQIDALLGRMDVLEWIDQHGVDPVVPSSGSGARLAGAASLQSVEPTLPPTDATSLSEMMRAQYVAAHQLENFPPYGDEVGLSLTAAGWSSAPAAVATAIPALTLSAMKRDDERQAYTYPGTGWIDASFSETAFYADDCGVSGLWTATASASSEGWSTDGANMDLATSLVGTAGSAASAVKFAKAAADGAEAGQTATRAAAQARKLQELQLDVGKSGAEQVALQHAEQNSAKEVPPETWGGIPLSANHGTMKQVGDPVLAIDGSTYTPIDTGTVLGYISPGNRETGIVFPPGMEKSESVTITVEEATVSLSGCPPTTYTPGQSYTLTASVEGLRDPNVPWVWSATSGEITPVAGSVEGQEQAIWTAPDPAPSGTATITAQAEANICIPEGASYPTAFCITSGSDYEIVLSPEESCYDTGDVVTLTFQNLNDLSATPDTEFEVVTGTATVVKTGPNTAELSSSQTGEVGVVARLVSDPNRLLTTTITFGCGEPMDLTLGPYVGDVQKLQFSTGPQNAYTLLGSFSASGGVITAEFDAASTYQHYLALDPETDVQYGYVGTDSNEGPIINPSLSVSLTIPYTVVSCVDGTPDYIECLDALNVDENSVVIQGLTMDYELDPYSLGIRIIDDYTINVIPQKQ